MGGFTMLSRRRFIQHSLLAGGGLLIMPSLYAGNGFEKLVIMHTNDLHCHVEPFPDNDPRYGGKGGMNRISAYIKHIRKSNPDMLLFDSGDFSQGTPYYNFFQAEVVLKLMSEMGYNASTIGNHEFDSGLDSLKRTIEFANFPIISSNYDFSSTVLNNQFKENMVIERKNLRIGVYALGIELLGLVGQSLSGDTVYKNPLETALVQEKYLKEEKGCDFIICLSHLGYEYQTPQNSDVILAKNTSYTDLILGGHTHTFLEKPVEVINQRKMPVVINQAGWASLMVGYLEFYFEKKKKTILDFSHNKRIE